METESEAPTGVLRVIPYHCEELANFADLEPLAEALASLQGTDRSAIRIDAGEPTQTQGVEAIIQFFIQLSSDPVVRGAVGAFGGAALGVFGKKFATWFWNWAHTKKQESLISAIYILPPASIPHEHRFQLSVEFEIGPQDDASAVYIPVGLSQVELENRAAGEFEKIEPVIKSLRKAWPEGNIPPNVTYAYLDRDRERGGYRISAHHVQPDGLDVGYHGTVTPDGDLTWSRY